VRKTNYKYEERCTEDKEDKEDKEEICSSKVIGLRAFKSI